MIMNAKLYEELTDLLADHLTMQESARMLRGERPNSPWERWRRVAEDAMEFMYGDTSPEAGTDPNHWSSYTGHATGDLRDAGITWVPRDDLVDDAGGVGPIIVEVPADRLALTGVFDPPTRSAREHLEIQFVPTHEVDLQLLSGALGPVPTSDSEQSAPSSPEPAEADE